MKRIVLTFGLIAGAIMAIEIALLPLMFKGTGFEHSEVVGYSSMVLAFIVVFFGIRTYRENSGGTITFGKAFQVGILMVLIVSVMYVVTWEIVYYNFMPDFAEKYEAFTIQKMKAKGATDAAIAHAKQEMLRFKELYSNPFFNIGMTFVEVFPVGLLMTLISAAILRRRTSPLEKEGVAA